MVQPRLLSCSALIGATLFAIGCGPTELRIEPKDVVDVKVRPASGQSLFCPGDNFELELIAKLRDGTTCSSADASRGCMGEKNAVIDPDQVRIEASPGAWADQAKFVFAPPADPLLTAQGGITLSGHVVLDGNKSMVGTGLVAPVYDCHKERLFGGGAAAANGAPGANGPDVTVTVTSLSTPWFPNAALVRVEAANQTLYLISPSADRPVKIVSRGQDGGMGAAGAMGESGAAGAAATPDAPCATGTDGLPGKNGGPGGAGGDGGAGGRIKLVLDDAKSNDLRGRVILESPGGAAGGAGPGGQGGWGGKGGAGGLVNETCAQSSLSGKDGASGAAGEPGTAGKAGAAGPAAEVSTSSRAALFAAELSTIQKIEAAPRASQ